MKYILHYKMYFSLSNFTFLNTTYFYSKIDKVDFYDSDENELAQISKRFSLNTSNFDTKTSNRLREKINTLNNQIGAFDFLF